MDASQLGEPRAVARTIYGTILVTALVAGLSEDDGIDAWQILVSVTGTTLVFWLAHVYAEVLSQRLAAGRALSRSEIAAAFDGELAMVLAGVPAALALGLAALGFYTTGTGVTLAIGVGVGALFAYGLVLGHREGVSRLQALAAASVNGAFGLVIVALKAFVH